MNSTGCFVQVIGTKYYIRKPKLGFNVYLVHFIIFLEYLMLYKFSDGIFIIKKRL